MVTTPMMTVSLGDGGHHGEPLFHDKRDERFQVWNKTMSYDYV
jgi:hypothetical protein